MRRLVRWGLGAVGLVLVAVLGWAGAVGLALAFGSARIEGTGQLAGADGPVTIVRDAHGVPHIFASSTADLYRGLGFVHAQDRFFQMDGARRLMQGRLAELIGAGVLKTDARQRILGWNRTIDGMWERLSPDARATMEAYAEGVNAGIAQSPAPPEYVFLLTRRAPWQAKDSLAVALAMTENLTRGSGNERNQARLSGRLTPLQLAQFSEPYPDWAARSYAPEDLPPAWRAASKAGGASQGPAHEGSPTPGSNGWVVAGSRTRSGKPVLANDPHLMLSAPGPFYLSRLQGPDGALVGASLPGAPNIVIGHNGTVAWGTTTHAIDAEDDIPLPADAALTTRTEQIKVRAFLFGSRTVTVEVRETDIGPVLDPEWFELPPAWEGKPHVRRTIADDADNGLPAAFLGASRAATVSDFVEALAPWTAPPQNLVVADSGGSIGLVSPARYPLRDASGAWVADSPPGVRLFAQNPARGYFATANNQQTPAGPGAGPATPGGHDPYRVTRIDEVLATASSHDVAASITLQADRLSMLARRLAPALAAATPQTDAGRAFQARLVAWDAVARVDREEGTLFALWTRAFGEALYRDDLGPELFERYPGPLEGLLDAALTDPAYAAWCDDQGSPAVESCALTAGKAMDVAATRLAADYGGAPKDRLWGKVHAARFPHPLFSMLPLIGERFTVTVPFGGSSTSVDVARSRHAEPGYSTIHAAGMRFVIDMAEPEAARFMVAPGQSGHPGSPFYRNLAPQWANGETFAISTDWTPDQPPPGSRTLRLAR